MFLSEPELEKLTGYKYGKYQCLQLKEKGIPFKTDAFGRPLVLKGYIEQMLGGVKKPRVNQPNFDALNG